MARLRLARGILEPHVHEVYDKVADDVLLSGGRKSLHETFQNATAPVTEVKALALVELSAE